MPDTSPQVWIHLASIAPALALGVSQFALPKGTPRHRGLGMLWAVTMLVAAVSSFWIRRDGLSWIHGLSVVTIVSVGMGVACAMKGRFHAHSRYILGAFIGSVGAGIGALAPGRMLHAVFFG